MTHILAFGDLHLGSSFTPGEKWVHGEIDAHRPDVVVFTGDLVDAPSADSDVFEQAHLLVEAIAQRLPLVMIWGNHDVGAQIHAEWEPVDGVFTPSGGYHQSITVPGIPLTFHAAHVLDKNDYRDIMDEFPVATEPGHIGVFHTSVTGEFSRNPCLPTTVDAMLSKNYDAWLLGHVHKPIQLHSDPLIAWPGIGHTISITV